MLTPTVCNYFHIGNCIFTKNKIMYTDIDELLFEKYSSVYSHLTDKQLKSIIKTARKKIDTTMNEMGVSEHTQERVYIYHIAKEIELSCQEVKDEIERDEQTVILLTILSLLLIIIYTLYICTH